MKCEVGVCILDFDRELPGKILLILEGDLMAILAYSALVNAECASIVSYRNLTWQILIESR